MISFLICFFCVFFFPFPQMRATETTSATYFIKYLGLDQINNNNKCLSPTNFTLLSLYEAGSHTQSGNSSI